MPNCVGVPNLVVIGQTRSRYGDFSIFPRWQPSTILDLLCVFGPPTKGIGGVYRCAKFGWNRCSSLDNMYAFRFRQFGLKTPVHAPKIVVLGILPPIWGAMSTNPKKAHPCASPRRLSHYARKSVDASDCRWVPEKRGINKFKKCRLYFTHSPRSPPRADVHQIWHNCRGRRPNHLWQIFWRIG